MILMTENLLKLNLQGILSGEVDCVFQMFVIPIPMQHVVHVYCSHFYILWAWQKSRNWETGKQYDITTNSH